MVGTKTLNKYIRMAKSLGISDEKELDDFICSEPELDSISGAEYTIIRDKLGI